MRERDRGGRENSITMRQDKRNETAAESKFLQRETMTIVTVKMLLLGFKLLAPAHLTSHHTMREMNKLLVCLCLNLPDSCVFLERHWHPPAPSQWRWRSELQPQRWHRWHGPTWLQRESDPIKMSGFCRSTRGSTTRHVRLITSLNFLVNYCQLSALALQTAELDWIC